MKTTRCNSECQYVFWKHTQTGCIRHHFPAGLVSGKQKNFRIKVEASQQRRRPHISAMRQAARAEDEAVDWSLGQEEWSIWSAILQNELFVQIHLSGKIKTIKYVFPVSSSFTTCRNLPKMWTIISMSCKSFGTQIIFSYKKLKIFVFGPQPWNQYMACKK